jgi:hypothetical protein
MFQLGTYRKMNEKLVAYHSLYSKAPSTEAQESTDLKPKSKHKNGGCVAVVIALAFVYPLMETGYSS